jgi:hypothetical protein
VVIDYNCRNINVDSYNGRDLRLVNCYGDLVVVRVNKSISKPSILSRMINMIMRLPVLIVLTSIGSLITVCMCATLIRRQV